MRGCLIVSARNDARRRWYYEVGIAKAPLLQEHLRRARALGHDFAVPATATPAATA